MEGQSQIHLPHSVAWNYRDSNISCTTKGIDIMHLSHTFTLKGIYITFIVILRHTVWFLTSIHVLSRGLELLHQLNKFLFHGHSGDLTWCQAGSHHVIMLLLLTKLVLKVVSSLNLLSLLHVYYIIVKNT